MKMMSVDKIMPRSSSRESLLTAVVIFLVTGTFFLSIIDKDCRIVFSDLAKIGVGGYIGLLMPKDSNKDSLR